MISMILCIIVLALIGYMVNYICYEILMDYYECIERLRGRQLVKKKRILLILTFVPFLITALSIVYLLTIGIVKAFINKWRGE